jgi:outer membrane lipoprotein SlyB
MKKTTLPVILLCALSLSACMSNEPYQTSRPYENAQTQYGAHGLEKNRGDNYYQIRIRMDDGGHHVVHQDDIGNLRNGDRIRIANGRAYLQ